MGLVVTVCLLCDEEVSEDAVARIAKHELLFAYLLIVADFSELLDVVALFNHAKVDVIGYPHILQGLKEEALL